jgi:hypothetical protein
MVGRLDQRAAHLEQMGRAIRDQGRRNAGVMRNRGRPG